ncbi:MAG: hypothetical protein ACHQ7N_18485 [Candidatus Methylomirabilales bacterium]
MRARRLFTLGPDNEPFWVRLCVQQIGEMWAAMIVADDASPPGPGELKGTGFLGATPEEAERQGKAYLGYAEPAN